MPLPQFQEAEFASFVIRGDAQRRARNPSGVRTGGAMDSGPAPVGASRN